MIKHFKSTEKTNSFRPSSWAYTTDPFPGIRGAGARYSVFLGVANGFDLQIKKKKEYTEDWFSEVPSKVIKTAKGGLLVVPCDPEEDQKILLATFTGGFRGSYRETQFQDAEILLEKSGNVHCCPTIHLIALLGDAGFVSAETGRRCSEGIIDHFGWNKYQQIDAEEYELFLDSHTK